LNGTLTPTPLPRLGLAFVRSPPFSIRSFIVYWVPPTSIVASQLVELRIFCQLKLSNAAIYWS
jgi:hypothetical protein